MSSVQPTHPEDVIPLPLRTLLEAELGNETPRLLLRSMTRVDTGGWFGKSRVWLCLTETDVLLLAASKRRYVQRLPISACKETQYCHTSGALLMQPSHQWRFNTIALPPADGLMVIQHLKNASQTKPTPVTEPTGA